MTVNFTISSDFVHGTNGISLNPSGVCMGLCVFQCFICYCGNTWICLYLNDSNNGFLNSKVSLILHINVTVIFMFPNEHHFLEPCFVVSSPLIQLLTLMLQTE